MPTGTGSRKVAERAGRRSQGVRAAGSTRRGQRRGQRHGQSTKHFIGGYARTRPQCKNEGGREAGRKEGAQLAERGGGGRRAAMVEESFEEFCDKWWRTAGQAFCREVRTLLASVQEPHALDGEGPSEVVVGALDSHVAGAMEELALLHARKGQATIADPLAMAAGLWRSPLEAALMWLGGWRPSASVVLAFSLMAADMAAGGPDLPLALLARRAPAASLAALSHAQVTQLDELQRRARQEEADLSARLCSVQILVANQDVACTLVAETRSGSLLTDPLPLLEEAEGPLRGALQTRLSALCGLLLAADALRLRTLQNLVSLLSPIQSAQYLLAAMDLLLALHRVGAAGLRPALPPAHTRAADLALLAGGPHLLSAVSLSPLPGVGFSDSSEYHRKPETTLELSQQENGLLQRALEGSATSTRLQSQGSASLASYVEPTKR